MNEKHVQHVMEIEKQAQEIHDIALREAQQLPILAEQDAQAIVQKAVSEAQEEARKLVSEAQAEEEVSSILTEADEKNRQVEALVMSNFDKAVTYILNRVVGKE